MNAELRKSIIPEGQEPPYRSGEYRTRILRGKTDSADSRDVTNLLATFKDAGKGLVSQVGEEIARDDRVAIAILENKAFSGLMISEREKVGEHDVLKITKVFLGRAVLADEEGAIAALFNGLAQKAQEDGLGEVIWGDEE